MPPRTGSTSTTSLGLRDRLRTLLVQSESLIRELEHGQASRPLTDHLNGLLADLASENAPSLLVTLDDPASRWADTFVMSLDRDAAARNGSPHSAPPSVETIPLTDARLWNRAARAASVLIVGSSPTNLTLAEQLLVDDLQAAGLHTKSIVVVDETSQSHTTPWAKPEPPPLVVGLDEAADGRLLRDELALQCEASRDRRCLARSVAAVTLVRGAIEERLRLCDYRRRLLQAKVSGQRRLEQEPSQKLFEALRRVWEDRFGRCETDLAERIREQLFPSSRISNRLRNLQDDLSADDMREERTGKSMRLEVSADFRQRARQVLERSVEEIIQADGQWLEQQITALQNDSRTAGSQERATLPTLSISRLETQQILNDLRRRMELELRYTGEIPRRTWFDWLSQGRRPVFALTMVLSIVGTAFGLGSGRSALLGPLLLALFLAGTGWAFFVFREERRHLLQRELTRLRDVVDNELRRLIDELFKDWQVRGVRWLRDTQKDWTRVATDWAREQQLVSTKSLERQRTEAQEQLKLLDGRSRELGQWTTQIDRLETTLTELAR